MTAAPRPAVFFDRDNTLIANDGYLGDPAGVVLVEGAAELVARVRRLGLATVVFSNQSGVARGIFTEAAVHAVNSRLDEVLLDADPAAVIDRHEFCPFHPEGTVADYCKESDLRKPHPGMIHEAAAALRLDLGRSWVVGDAPRDIEAGQAAGCRTILVKDPSLSASPAAEVRSTVKPDFIVSSLREAGDVIEREAVVPPPPAPADRAPEPTEAPVPDALPYESQVATRERRPKSDDPAERLESLVEEILEELRRRDDVRDDFSITKLFAGIVQVIALAALFMAYLRRDSASLEPTLLTALVFQTFTIALLLMERQRG